MDETPDSERPLWEKVAVAAVVLALLWTAWSTHRGIVAQEEQACWARITALMTFDDLTDPDFGPVQASVKYRSPIVDCVIGNYDFST